MVINVIIMVLFKKVGKVVCIGCNYVCVFFYVYFVIGVLKLI